MPSEANTKDEGTRVLLSALRLLAKDGCQSFHGATCITSGRKRNAQYLADAWCYGCVATDALERASSLKKIARYKGKPVTVKEKHRLQKRAGREVARQFHASFRRSR